MRVSWLSEGCQAYRLWDPVAKKLVVSIDVSFNELPLLKEGENVHDAVDWIEGEIEHEYAHEDFTRIPPQESQAVAP